MKTTMSAQSVILIFITLAMCELCIAAGGGGHRLGKFGRDSGTKYNSSWRISENSTSHGEPSVKLIREKGQVEGALDNQDSENEDNKSQATVDGGVGALASRSVRNPGYFPHVNFYSTVAMSLGALGQGVLALREFSNSVGSPLLLWLGHIPLFLLTIALLFVPNLRPLRLPAHYYTDLTGEEDDPVPLEPVKWLLPDNLEFLRNTLIRIITDYINSQN